MQIPVPFRILVLFNRFNFNGSFPSSTAKFVLTLDNTVACPYILDVSLTVGTLVWTV